MAELMELEVITPERRLFSEEVEALIIPGAEGQLGVLPRHASMAVLLEAGVLVYRQEGSMGRIALSGGFCDVDEDRIVVLADTAEKAENIDILRAREAKERALQRLRSREETMDAARARAALERALARLKAAGAE